MLRVIKRPEPFKSPSKVALSKAIIAIAQLDCSMERKKSKPGSSLNHCVYVAGGVAIITCSAIAGALSRSISIAESVVESLASTLFSALIDAVLIDLE